MAKKVVKLVKLQVLAGKATPAPPVGPALGQAGVNIMAFVKEFNERTAKQGGLIIPVEISVKKYMDETDSLMRELHETINNTGLNKCIKNVAK